MSLHTALKHLYLGLPEPVKRGLGPAKGVYVSATQLYQLSRSVREVAPAIRRSLEKSGQKGIFIDLGFNSGQATKAFMRALPESVTFIGMEPNEKQFGKRCKRLVDQFSPRLTDIVMAAASNADGTLTFYTKGERFGVFPYISSTTLADFHPQSGHRAPYSVPAIDFSNWLKTKFGDVAQERGTVILKMDIEGAEYDVLEKMLQDGTIALVDHLIVEFHAACFKGAKGVEIAARENRIREALKDHPVRVHEWI